MQGVNASKYKFMTYDAINNIWIDSGFTITIDNNLKTATITVTHFSTFSLGINTGTPTTSTSNGTSTGTNNNAFSIPGYQISGILSSISIAVLIIIRKRKNNFNKES
jgi:hypothetical protein